MKKAINQFLNRLEYNTNVNTKSLSYSRVFLGAYILIIMPLHWQWIAELPNTFFFPVVISPAKLFTGIPDQWFFFLIELVFYLCVVLFTIGVYSRYALFIGGIVAIFGQSFAFAFGKIDHNLFLFIACLVLAFTNCGRYLALRKDKPVSLKLQRTALGIGALCIAFALFSAGYGKSWKWLDFDMTEGGFLRWFYTSYFVKERQDLLSYWITLFPAWAVELMDYTAVIFELTGLIFMIVGRKAWRVYLGIAVFFHLANYLFLNINFTANVPIYVIFLLSPLWMELDKVLKNRTWIKKVVFGLIAIQAIIMLANVLGLTSSEGLNFLVHSGISEFLLVSLWASIVCVTLICLFQGRYKKEKLE
jgi:hypothetical protein